jgi:hypothetical protein
MTRGRAFRAVFAIAASLPAACSLVRSLDGFSDDWGKHPDASDAAQDVAPADAGDSGLVDAGFTCDPPEVIWNGGTRDLLGPYVHGMAQDKDNLYIVGGTYAPDASPNALGFAVRIDKATHTPTTIASGLNQPTAVTTTSDAVYVAAAREVLRVASDGGAPSLVKQMAGTVYDLTSDPAGLFFVEQRGAAGILSGIYFLSDAGFQETGRPHPYATRIEVSKDAVFVSRLRESDAGGTLVRYDRASAFLYDPDAGAAAPGCELEDASAVLALDVGGDVVAWGANAPKLFLGTAAASGCGATHYETLSRPLAVAVGPRALFVRYDAFVRVFTPTGGLACEMDLQSKTNDNILGNRVTRGAVFDGDTIYFTTPERVYQMRLR